MATPSTEPIAASILSNAVASSGSLFTFLARECFSLL